MPVSKNQLGRLLVIHNLLATGRGYNWEQLADACEVAELVGARPSKRTIQEDIRMLQEVFRAPIPKWKTLYRYTKPFSFLAGLTTDDAQLLQEALALVAQFEALPQADAIQEVLLKLRHEIGIRTEGVSNVIFFEQTPELKGIAYLNQLYNYIRQECCITVTYLDFKEQWHQLLIHPYVLKAYNNRWYVIGREHETGKLYPLALDRIEALAWSNEAYQPADPQHTNAYYEAAIGVTIPEEQAPITLVLEVKLPRAHYVRTKPLHSSQQLLATTATNYVFQYNLYWNKELEAKLLELGPDARVRQPTALVERMQLLIQEMLKRYIIEE